MSAAASSSYSEMPKNRSFQVICRNSLPTRRLWGQIDGIGSNLAGRFSGLLERMEQTGPVRLSGAPDGRRRLWEIARKAFEDQSGLPAQANCLRMTKISTEGARIGFRRN